MRCGNVVPSSLTLFSVDEDSAVCEWWEERRRRVFTDLDRKLRKNSDRNCDESIWMLDEGSRLRCVWRRENTDGVIGNDIGGSILRLLCSTGGETQKMTRENEQEAVGRYGRHDIAGD